MRCWQKRKFLTQIYLVTHLSGYPKNRNATGKIKWGIVVDFRKYNKKSDQDAYLLPVIDYILNHLDKAKFSSAFDLSLSQSKI